MADKETAALTAATALTGPELSHIVQGGNSRKVTEDQRKTFLDNRITRDLVKGAFGSMIGISVLEQELTLTGASVSSTTLIPNGGIVLGVGSRTTLAVTGAPSYGVGISGEVTKFGGALGVALGSTNKGIIGPTAFYADTAVTITPTSGSFTGGKVRIAIYVLTFTPPTS